MGWKQGGVLILTVCLLLPVPTLALVKGGRRNFREGSKYETLQQWDLAAQQYALAVAAEPNNPEYKLRYMRALQQASLMFVKRGDALAEQGDYASAYSAYRQSFSYDQGNEIARLKMERMLDIQKAQTAGTDIGTTNKIGNVFPTNNEIQFSTRARSRDTVHSISFKETKFKSVISNLCRELGLNVVFDESVKDLPLTIELVDVTFARALDILLRTYKFSFEQVDHRTILVYADNATNRPRFENLMVKTFYLSNLTSAQARTALTALLPAGRQIASVEQPNTPGGNTLIVKATAT
ncbi:MAG: FecR domain-containing protein [Blastocatellia bacterium]